MPRRASKIGREELLTAEGCLRLGVATRLSSAPPQRELHGIDAAADIDLAGILGRVGEPLGNQQKEQVIARDARTKARQRDEAFRWLMGDRKGRLLMWELLDKTGVFRGGLIDTARLLFNEGARNVGLKYLADIQRLTPHQFVTMQAEVTTRQKNPDGDKDDRADAES